MSVSQDVCTAPKEGCLIRRLSHDVGHHLIRRRKIDLNRVLQVQLTGKMQPSRSPRSRPLAILSACATEQHAEKPRTWSSRALWVLREYP